MAVRELVQEQARVVARKAPAQPPPQKRRRTGPAPDDSDSEDEYQDLCDEPQIAEDDEVGQYMSLQLGKVKSCDILKWWKEMVI